MKRGQINTLFPTNVTSRNPCWLWWQVAVQPLTHSGAVSHIRHAAARGDIGDRQPAQRMKADEQLSAGCAACNPVLTTLVRPPRRLELGRQSLFFFSQAVRLRRAAVLTRTVPAGNSRSSGSTSTTTTTNKQQQQTTTTTTGSSCSR